MSRKGAPAARKSGTTPHYTVTEAVLDDGTILQAPADSDEEWLAYVPGRRYLVHWHPDKSVYYPEHRISLMSREGARS